jgi:hypothetical protein
VLKFAAIVCEVEPIFTKIIQELTEAKEANDIAMGLRKSKAVEAALLAKQRKIAKEEKKRLKLLAKSEVMQSELGPNEEEDAEELDKRLAQQLETEEKKKLQAVADKAEREKAWFMAHPHKFIKHPGERAFCIVCKEKEFDYWQKQNKSMETSWRAGFSMFVAEVAEGQESAYREQAEGELKDDLMRKAQLIIDEEVRLEGLSAQTENAVLKSIGKSFNGFKKSSKNLLGSVVRGTNKPVNHNETTTDDDDSSLWSRELNRIRNLVLKSGLCLVDPHGSSVLPRKPPKKAAVKMYSPPVIVENDNDNLKQETVGLCLRVWHKDTDGNRAHFLGSLFFTEKV